MQQLGIAAMQTWLAGDSERAEQLARAALTSDPNDANALQVLGGACLKNGRVTEAVRHLQSADRAAPDSPTILNTLGVALRRAGDLDGARRAYARAGRLGSPDAWRNLGALERGENQIDAAIAAFSQALALQPNAAATHAGLAQLYETRHDVERAREHAEHALRVEPTNELALIALGRVLLRERDWAGAEALLTPLGRNPRAGAVNRAIAIGLIGEALDRQGRAGEAFDAFTASNGILRHLHAAAADDLASPFHPATVERLTHFMEAEEVTAWSHPKNEQAQPVFLVGFPRSGTTLLDQILASHSGIVCLEEKELLAPGVADLLAAEALPRWKTLDTQTIQDRREAYRQRALSAGAPDDGRIFVDKLPLNLVLLPVIARLFPDAKVIVALRDPRDAVLSAYQQRFGMNPAMAQMLELASAARYYNLAMTLLERSREKLPLQFHDVRYEDVVADIESAARGLTDFIGVPFEPAMLDFNATARRRAINTPSARQVIQPLYTRSVARWRAYAPHLAPVLPILEPWVRRYGYDV